MWNIMPHALSWASIRCTSFSWLIKVESNQQPVLIIYPPLSLSLSTYTCWDAKKPYIWKKLNIIIFSWTCNTEHISSSSSFLPFIGLRLSLSLSLLLLLLEYQLLSVHYSLSCAHQYKISSSLSGWQVWFFGASLSTVHTTNLALCLIEKITKE